MTAVDINDLATFDKFSYQTVQDVILISPGCWMFKADLARAYQSVKLRPQEHTISGLEWTLKGDLSPTWDV